ncbi:hypothetical protein IC582_004930 [Cucumis melo]
MKVENILNKKIRKATQNFTSLSLFHFPLILKFQKPFHAVSDGHNTKLLPFVESLPPRMTPFSSNLCPCL